MPDSNMQGELIVKGITRGGDRFRPSDWAERLCGVLAVYRPGHVATRGPVFGYSPYAVPTMIAGVVCVVVDPRLRELEVLAWDFIVGFARDNDLVTMNAVDLVAVPVIPAIPPAAG